MTAALIQPGQWDVRGALRDLLNLKAPESAFYGKDSSADEFIGHYGALREVSALSQALDLNLGIKSDTALSPRHAVRMASGLFRAMWEVSDKAGAQALLNGGLAAVFAPAQIDGEERPAGMRVDIMAGTIEPVPRDFLDALALEFMRSYRTIGLCQRCRRFFFKSYPSDRYCSGLCGDAARSEAQSNWMRNKRAQDAEEKRKKKSRKAKRRIQ